MKLVVNGEPREIPDPMSVRELLDWLEVPRGRVAVEVNLELLPKTQFDSRRLAEGDRLEIVTFVGGG